MSLVLPNFRALQSRAEFFVNAPFDDESISTFCDDVKWRIANYMAIVHQAGMHAAELVQGLPYAAEEGGFEDAFMGAYILRQTEQALRELLEEDEEMSKMIQAYYTTTNEEDADARRKSQEFDRDHLSDLNGEFRQSAKGYETGRASDGQIADSAAGGSRRTLDEHVEAAQDRPEQTIEVRVYEDGVKRGSVGSPLPELPADTTAAPDANVPAVTPVDISVSSVENPAPPKPEEDDEIEDIAVRLFGEKPERITVKAPDYSKSTPNSAFRSAIGWMVDHIIMAGSGSKNRGKYPRIAPLMIKQVPAARLRLPGDEGGGFPDIARKLRDLDPGDSAAVRDVVDEFMNMLGSGGSRRSNEPAWAASAREDGGWKESGENGGFSVGNEGDDDDF